MKNDLNEPHLKIEKEELKTFVVLIILFKSKRLESILVLRTKVGKEIKAHDF